MTHAMTPSPDALRLLAQPGLPFTAALAVKFAVSVTKWATRRRTRLALRQLEAWQLADVGLTPAQARTEAARAFWRA